MSKQEWETIGEGFLSQFFSNNTPEHFSQFYGNDSVLSVEKDKFLGAKDIIEKLTAVKTVKTPEDYEIQPSNNGILIFLSGKLQLENETNAFPFIRVFFLAPTQQGTIYVKNDMYKLTFG
mmetsp:Transcript_15935/g.16534  ORF Transcript_15935/g.16534 Transcript_15935/m.16534 type:complete len:120 (-) Transcript_15935:97-456(-)|eukprot:CAMPEP_0170515312 /NCGR_PEP_ID=MMETSP0209-20121228/1752_1 /TAXON_ID=665100 ORGANISM="Litonotus pictus, Strain P1" /NCGR_SAMPLE_ID=MMETSP0209 /ASSEMBLY_ACC=CAM_ASM_000301 /LENGTH=119 /DNA_ID=CAMNT_0010799735 /DNA_START=7 /DNA_END=366 /DNA_ORIENTATION=+